MKMSLLNEVPLWKRLFNVITTLFFVVFGGVIQWIMVLFVFLPLGYKSELSFGGNDPQVSGSYPLWVIGFGI